MKSRISFRENYLTPALENLSGVPRQLKEICVGAEVLDGLAIVGSQVRSSKSKAEEWI